MEQEFKKLIVDIPKKLHVAFKNACNEKDTSMKAVVTELIEGFMKEYKKRG